MEKRWPKLRGVGVGIARWAVFAVLLALLPIGVNALITITDGHELGVVGLLEHGELMLVSAAVVGAAIAELMADGVTKLGGVRVGVGVGGGLVVVAASVWFAVIATGERDGSELDPGTVATGSLIVFLLAVVAGLSCVVVAELAKR
jgi:predicted Kef-type K+ transport protein